MTGPPDRDLVDRCRQGDDDAFRVLVERYQRLVFGVIARSVRDRGRAEELAQEVFLRVFRGLPHFRGESRLSTWICRVALNVLAQEPRRPGMLSLDEVRADDERPMDPGSPDPVYGEMELRDRLAKAIERLPAQYQIVIHGHYLKELTYDELADALGLPMGTVKTHLHRAKRLLRRLLETELG